MLIFIYYFNVVMFQKVLIDIKLFLLQSLSLFLLIFLSTNIILYAP